MNKISKNEKGFSVVETLLVLVIVVLIGIVGYMVYKNHHKTTVPNNTAKTSTTSSHTKPIQQPTQKYITITAWGVRVPYSGNDTLTVSNQTCDQPGDTVLGGCSFEVDSQNLANSVGNCQSNRATGKVGHFYRMGTNDNYIATNGSGYTPVTQWVTRNPGQYTMISNYYYAFAIIGAAWGGSGAVSINTSTNALADTVPAGCNNWIKEYNAIEPSVSALASKFEVIPN